MDSDDERPVPRHRHQRSHGIPLQTLNGHGDLHTAADQVRHDSSHRRTLSDRGRALFSASRRSRQEQRYAPLSPTTGASNPAASLAQERLTGPPHFYVSSPTGERHRLPDEDDENVPSSAIDAGAFQAAIGFAGLSFNAANDYEEEQDTDTDDTPPRVGRMTRDSLPSLHTSRDSLDDLTPVTLDDGPAFFSPGARDEDDTLPLTDSSHTRPSMLDPSSSPRDQRHDRSRRPGSGLSVRFVSGHARDKSSPRLGDDLEGGSSGLTPDSALGRSPSSRKRSLSNASSGAESAIQRTGTILLNMSQRVVNLSNEAEVVDRVARRSTEHRRREHSPTPVIQVDGPPSDEPFEHAPLSPASEKPPSPFVEIIDRPKFPTIERNPLKGKALGIFSAESRVRRNLLEIITHPVTEPLILLVIITQTVILTIDSAKSVYDDPRPTAWGTQWTDYMLFGIFCIYTIEIAIKCIVSGFFLNPIEYSTVDRKHGLRKAMAKKANDLFALQRKPTHKRITNPLLNPDEPPSLLRSFTAPEFDQASGSARQAQRIRLARRAFLRHSFNRVDFVAVVSFWISIVLGAAGVEASQHIWVFRMMSCLRILRLLRITNGTSIILRSLKRAAPTLLNVGFLIGFFWLLFAIVGVQSFKSSFRRQCQTDVDTTLGTYYFNQTGAFVFCGGWLAQDGSAMPWLTADGRNGSGAAKGYLCPIGSLCVENMNPYAGTISYDNIISSAQLVFVLMSSNTFSDLMYNLTETDYLAAAIFTAIGIIIMNLWLINLLIAVITSSFQVIRDESKSSAFMADEEHHFHEKSGVDEKPKKISTLRRMYDLTYWVWIAIIAFGLIMQSLRSDIMGEARSALIDASELGVTLILAGEIVFRIVADWRDFPHHRRNWFDLALAIITCVLQIPVIKESGEPYAWLSFFQIVRIYRIVLAVSITRELILLVLRFVTPVANLMLFVFLLTYLVSIFAVQLFRGDIPQEDPFGEHINTTFATIYNAFLGMYQIFSSENWTTIMYTVAMYNTVHSTAWIGVIFFILWFILGFFIVLPMFIAVIQENFDVSEDQKRLQQVRMFLLRKEMGVTSNNSTPSLSSIFKFGHVKRQDPLDYGNAASEMLLKDAVVRDFLDEHLGLEGDKAPDAEKLRNRDSMLNFATIKPGVWSKLIDKLKHRIFSDERNPFYSRLKLTRPYEELDPRTLAKEVHEATDRRKLAQREYLRQHPNYNTSLYLFKPSNPLRKICQRIVGPGRGHERAEGLAPNPQIWYTFSALIYAAIVAMVLLACITTPLFQKEYFESHEFRIKNWFVFTDMAFAALFTIEALIKIIADGLFFTPNAYFRSSWGFIDGVVLITLWANVATYLHNPGDGSRTIGAFKALRALRLLNISDSARDTFHSVIILGGWKIVSAAFVSISLLIPFAIYALNLFAGTMQSCNDGQGVSGSLTDCTGEYFSSPSAWNVLAPRQVSNSYFDFDNFGNSLFILFQIVSQEGWIDVQWSAQSVTGIFTQPSPYSRQGNALFFVAFNLIATVFVLTLFVSVFMRTYTEQTGVAFLTTEQRSWVEFSKLLRQIAPSKRPASTSSMSKFRAWCYARAFRKSGAWQRSVTMVLIVHLILLCLEYYPEPLWWSKTRDAILFIFTIIYIAHIVIRIVGLSFTRFRKSAWDVFSVIAVSATFITSVMSFVTGFDNHLIIQANKLCLDSIVLLLIPRNNHLDQLFKTAAASLASIFNLLATWFVLFLVYAIALSQTFGLTRFSDNETNSINVRTVPKALILLFRCSMGEGWNQIMEDYARIRTPYCVVGDSYFDGDCGSAAWARALFISWNIVSMYIFVNLFIALIYESFSYVYQRNSGMSIISREEIRRYKQAWAEHDPDGRGYISKEQFPKFLNELSGVFEMRIYDGDFTVRRLLEDCQKKRRESSLPVDNPKKEVDLKLLNQKLAELPVDEIRRRRARMDTFYEEVLVSADPDRGISFSTLLMILAHYKVINDNKSLKLDEFLRRRARLQRVEEAVNRNIVVGFFDTLYWSRQFKKHKERKNAGRMTELPQFTLPEILVQDEAGENVPQSKHRMGVPSVSITPVDGEFPAHEEDLRGSPSHVRNQSSLSFVSRDGSSSIHDDTLRSPDRESFIRTPQHRSSHSTSSQTSVQPDWHFAAALESAGTGVSPPTSPGLSPAASGPRSRASSAVSQHEMVDMFENSAWGESMRRSATQKRESSVRRSPH